MIPDEELEKLDKAAEEIALEYPESESDFSSESSEDDPALANAAAVGPPSKRQRSYKDEELDAVNSASWQDMEEERMFLSNTHRNTLNSLINRLECSVEDGDDVDLLTERIVANSGHLNALKPQQDLMQDYEDEEDDENEEEEEEEEFLYAVCQRPLTKLGKCIESVRGWVT